jgi:hypothetical protein
MHSSPTIDLLGLLLAVMGIYSTVSYIVVLRTREVEVRIMRKMVQRTRRLYAIPSEMIGYIFSGSRSLFHVAIWAVRSFRTRMAIGSVVLARLVHIVLAWS